MLTCDETNVPVKKVDVLSKLFDRGHLVRVIQVKLPTHPRLINRCNTMFTNRILDVV